MSLTATALVLGLFVLVAIKANWARPLGALVCVVFGLVLASTAAGPAVHGALSQLGTSIWRALQGM